jgi:CubicO group peptidase (beta-lactamase class C family)
MTDTFFRVPPEEKQRLAAAYVPGKDDIQNVPGESVMHHDLTFGIVRISSDYPYSQSHRLLSGGAGLCSTASDYMRFALMILNGGQLHGVPLLTDESVHMMTTNQVENRKEGGGIGFGFGIYTDTEPSPLGLRSSYASSGFWSTHCRISPQGDWTVIAMSQLAWDFDLTPQWFAEYEKIAAEAIEN